MGYVPIFLAALAAQPALALEKCTGADGKVTYSDRGCATGSKRAAFQGAASSAQVQYEYYEVSAPGGHKGRADWRLSYKLTTRGLPGGGCAVNTVATDLSLKVRLPRWTPPAGAQPGLVARWQSYLSALEVHEQGHVQHGRDFEASFRAAAQSIGAEDCGAVSAAVNARFQSLLEQARQRDIDYDKSTSHGATQGAHFR